jgi:hypothetical protein
MPPGLSAWFSGFLRLSGGTIDQFPTHNDCLFWCFDTEPRTTFADRDDLDGHAADNQRFAYSGCCDLHNKPLL